MRKINRLRAWHSKTMKCDASERTKDSTCRSRAPSKIVFGIYGELM